MSKTTTGVILLLLSQVTDANQQIQDNDDQMDQLNFVKLQLESDLEDIQSELDEIILENTKLDTRLHDIQ